MRRVTIQFPDGHIQHFEVSRFASTLDFKKTLESLEGIPAPAQSLVRNNKVLSDRDFPFKSNTTDATIRLISWEFLVLQSSRQSIRIYMLPRSTVGEVKRQISEKSASALKLVLSGRVLQDEQQVSSLGDSGRFVVHLLRPSERFVWVKTLDDFADVIIVREAHTAETLKRLIEEQTGLPTCEASLYFRGSQLQEGEPIAFSDGAVLSVYYSSRICVHVSSAGKQAVLLTLSGSDSVSHLVAVLRTNTSLSGIAHVLRNGVELAASQSVSEAGLQNGATLEFGEVIFTVQYERLNLLAAVCVDISVSCFKDYIAQKVSAPREKLEVVYEAEVLSEEKQLSDYRFPQYSVLTLYVRCESYVWVKSSSRLVLVEVNDLDVRLEVVLQQFEARVSGSFEFLPIKGAIMDRRKSLSSYLFSSGSVLEVYDSSLVSVVSVASSRKTILLEVERRQTVKDVKEAVWRRLCVATEFTMMCEGTVLADETLLSSLPQLQLQVIHQHESVYHFRTSPSVLLSVPFKHDTRIAFVKKRLQKDLHAPSCFLQLSHNGEAVEDTRRIADFTCLDVTSTSTPFVWVITSRGKCSFALPGFHITVAELKAICGLSGDVTFFNGQKKMENRLQDCSVRTATRLVAVMAAKVTESPGDGDDYCFVETVKHQAFLTRFTPGTPWNSLLHRLTRGASSVLIRKNTLVNTSSPIDIPTGSVLRLYTEETKVAIVRNFTGKVTCVPFTPSTTVLSLKAALKTSLHLRLHWRILDDNATLLSYGVSPLKLIEIVLPTEQIFTLHRPEMSPLLTVLEPPLRTVSSLLSVLKSELNMSSATFIQNDRYMKSSSILNPSAKIWLLTYDNRRIAFLDGKVRTIYMTEKFPIRSLKSAIFTASGTEVSRMILSGVLLDGDSELISLEKFGWDYWVDLVKPQEIIVTLVHRYWKYVIALSATDKISKLYNCLPKSLSSAKIYYENKHLTQSNSLSKYGITTDVKLLVITHEEIACLFCSGSREFFITSHLSKDISFSTLAFDISHATGSEATSLLWLDECVNRKTVEDYNLQPGSELTLVTRVRQRGEEKMIHLQFASTQGQIVTVDVETGLTIAEVKKEISRLSSLQPECFLISGFCAREEWTIGDYPVSTSSPILMRLPGDVLVTLLLPRGLTYLICAAQTSISALKTLIEEKTSIPAASQQLFREQEVLTDELSVEHCACSKTLTVRAVGDDISVMYGYCFERMQVDFQANRLPFLKAKLARLTNLKEDFLQVYFEGLLLTGDETLASYALGPGTIIAVFPSFLLRIHTPLTAPFDIPVTSSDSFSHVKIRLAEMLNVPPSAQRLIASHSITEEVSKQSLQRLGPIAHFQVTLALPPHTLILFVEDMHGKRVTIHTTPSAQVCEVCMQAQKAFGTTVTSLLREGKPLPEKVTVQEAGLGMFSSLRTWY